MCTGHVGMGRSVVRTVTAVFRRIGSQRLLLGGMVYVLSPVEMVVWPLWPLLTVVLRTVSWLSMW